MRGEFIRGDDLRVANNITTFGAKYLLGLIFDSTKSAQLFIGLGSAVYDPALPVSQVHEPTLTNGYARIAVPRDAAHWSIPGQVNGEWYAESAPVVFAPTGVGFSQSVSRMFLSDSLVNGNLIALSGAMAASLAMTPALSLAQRTFKYRLYLR